MFSLLRKRRFNREKRTGVEGAKYLVVSVPKAINP